MLGFPTAIGAAALCSAMTLLLFPHLGDLPQGFETVVLYSLWGVLGLVWIAVRHLLKSMELIWNTYEENQDLVRQSREFQLQLLQSIEELKEANGQLTRLNKLAQKLRFEAEQERSIKTRFVANVSHELRTPLNMIVGFCEVIIKSPEVYGGSIPPALMSDLDVVLRNAEHLSSLINDVLDLSQIDAGQMTISKEMVYFPKVIDSAVVAVRNLFLSKGLYLRTDIDPGIGEVFCDEVRIREVLLNLLSNAGRFVEAGGVEITVRQKNESVLVGVSDTGPGIDETEKEKLFKPFHQLDFTVNKRMGGTGLGLSISKGFVDLHGGKMWVEGQKGVGTTFFFKIPLETPAPIVGNPARWLVADARLGERGRPKARYTSNVLPQLAVVEQGKVLYNLLVRQLQNVELVPFSDIHQALLSAESSIFSAIIVNDTRAGQTLSSITALPDIPPHLPVLVCDIPNQKLINAEYGLADYLIKPISSEALLASIDRLDVTPRQILLIDDNLDAIKLLRRYLTSFHRGYRLFQATNGFQALEILAKHHIDLILMDLVMPEMDGIQFLQARLEQPALRSIPVILTTARDPQEPLNECQTVAVTYRDGISTSRLISTIENTMQVFSSLAPPAGLTPLETHPV